MRARMITKQPAIFLSTIGRRAFPVAVAMFWNVRRSLTIAEI